MAAEAGISGEDHERSGKQEDSQEGTRQDHEGKERGEEDQERRKTAPINVLPHPVFRG
jgi:hypothetical protein